MLLLHQVDIKAFSLSNYHRRKFPFVLHHLVALSVLIKDTKNRINILNCALFLFQSRAIMSPDGLRFIFCSGKDGLIYGV
jgi:hypothetical protein